jgi:hypothetical protein
MTSKILRRREAKAKRRKQVLAERRKLTGVASNLPLTTRVRRLAAMPLHSCLAQDGLFERGIGTVILARQQGDGQLAIASFLLDVFCLGVKDAFFRSFEPSEFEEYIDDIGQGAALSAVDPSYARKLLRDTVAYARSIGFEPHHDFAAVESLFGNVSAGACDVGFEFGVDGKPLYVPGPSETEKQISRRLEHLRARLGEDGFDFAFEDDDLEDEEAFDGELELLEGEEPYDAAQAPDPETWLAHGEDRRHLLVEAYHSRAGILLEDDIGHVALHVAVEDQIAEANQSTLRAMERLMGGGLDRHDALHAVGSVLGEHLLNIIEKLAEGSTPSASELEASHHAYYAALERLTADSWRRSLDEDEDEDLEDA